MIFVGAHFINSYQFLLEMLEVKLYENDGVSEVSPVKIDPTETWTK